MDVIAFIATLIIFAAINLTYVSFAKDKVFFENTDEMVENIIVEEIVAKEENIDLEQQSYNWELEIPKIELKAEIAEGTTKEVMDKYIGHFDNTSLWNGNIGLAAHNRGYPVNYFGRLKELVQGDEIIYRCKEGEKKYTVNLITQINDTDWQYLESSEENKITLITCVENQPSFRRCIQAIEKNRKE